MTSDMLITENVAFVYLAAHGVEERFKIGLSCDPPSRLRALPERCHLDPHRTLVRCFSTRKRACEVEGALHKAMEPYRCWPPHRQQGFAEWFRIEGFDQARDMLACMPAAVGPIRSLSGGRRRPVPSASALTAYSNLRKTAEAAALWREAACLVRIVVHRESNGIWLEFPKFRWGALDVGIGIRMELQDLVDSYSLHARANGKARISLVSQILYVGPASEDLRITLTPPMALRGIPGGEKIVRLLGATIDDLEAIMQEWDEWAIYPKEKFTEEQLALAMERWMDRRDETFEERRPLWD